MEKVQFHYELPIDKIDDLPKKLSGIYVFYKADNTVLYVGLSKNILPRIKLHLSESSLETTSPYKHLIHKVGIIRHDDINTLEVLETEMINLLCPVLNKRKVEYQKSGLLLNPESESICSANDYSGNRCTNKAIYNGFCVIHDPSQSEIPSNLRGKYVTIEMLRLLKTADFPNRAKSRPLFFKMSKYTLRKLLLENTYADIQFKNNEPVYKFKHHFIIIDDEDIIRLTRYG